MAVRACLPITPITMHTVTMRVIIILSHMVNWIYYNNLQEASFALAFATRLYSIQELFATCLFAWGRKNLDVRFILALVIDTWMSVHTYFDVPRMNYTLPFLQPYLHYLFIVIQSPSGGCVRADLLNTLWSKPLSQISSPIWCHSIWCVALRYP